MNQPEAFGRLYLDATIFAKQTSQTIGEKRDYYITLEQLMELMKPYIYIKSQLAE